MSPAETVTRAAASDAPFSDAGFVARELTPVPALAYSPVAGLLAAAPALVALGVPARPGAAALIVGSSILTTGALAAVARAAQLTPRAVAPWLVPIGLAAPFVAGFAALVKATTHHRPLGAATVAVGALALVLVLGVLAQRAGGVAAARSPGVAKVVGRVLLALAATAGASVALLAFALGDGAQRAVVGQGLAGAIAVVVLAVLPERSFGGRRAIVFSVFGGLAAATLLGLWLSPGARGMASLAAPWLGLVLGG